MSYRQIYIESDFAGFAQPTVVENGGMVVVSPKGRADKPILCQSEADVITNYGTPSVTYPSLFEAVAYCKTAPCYIISAIGDSALYGGVLVKEDSVSSIVSGTSDLTSYTFPDNSYSFGLFASSQCDSTLKVNVITSGGKKFKATLYESASGKDVYLKEYNFSLLREKDNFGYSLYYGDVFNDDTYIIPVVNASTTATTYTVSGSTKYTLGGGSRGGAPSDSNKTTAWSKFNSANKYPVTTFMDCFGDHATDVNNLIQTYQPYAHGISIIPLGKTAAQMVTYRNSLSIDSDNVSLYGNWAKIVDPYNNSYVWISNAGSMGSCYAKMADVFDGLAPAGISENNHGGQISTWRPVEVELDFSDSDLQSLDNAQINPFVLDEIYGLMAQGDKTLQVSLSDTSYIGTRRLYNLIVKNITRQVLKKQEFKNNDTYHRFKAKSMIDDMLAPIVGLGLFREILVVCSEENNTDQILQLRQFVVDIYCRVVPTSEFVVLRLNRLSQTQTIAEFLQQ